MDLGPPEDLVDEQVAQARDDRLVQQRRFHLAPGASHPRTEVGAGDILGVGAEVAEHALGVLGAASQPQPGQLAHVPIPQFTIVQNEADAVVAVVLFPWPAQRNDPVIPKCIKIAVSEPDSPAMSHLPCRRGLLKLLPRTARSKVRPLTPCTTCGSRTRTRRTRRPSACSQNTRRKPSTSGNSGTPRGYPVSR